MKNQFGLKPKRLTFLYKRPYPEWYDLVALPTNYSLPEFAKLTGQDSISIIEHVSRYLTQLGEASVEEAHRVRFFSLSLSRSAFTWFHHYQSTPLPIGPTWRRSFIHIFTLGLEKRISPIWRPWDRGLTNQALSFFRDSERLGACASHWTWPMIS